jgi:DNA replication protein DnaC
MTTVDATEPAFAQAGGAPNCPRCGAFRAGRVVEIAGRQHTRVCAECETKLRQRDEAERVAELDAERGKREKFLRSNLEMIGVNVRRYVDQRQASFQAFDPSPDDGALRRAQEFVDVFRTGQRPSLYLYGSRRGEKIAAGNGKTHLAIAILRELALDPAVPVASLRFVFVPELLLEIQDTMDSPGLSMLDVVRSYTKPELLVWDDFGAEKLSEFAVRTLFTILYKREGRSNVFTSNLSLDQVAQRDSYAERITSRIAGDAVIRPMTGPDRRPLLRSGAAA